MPQLNINGAVVSLTVDELIEYQTKMTVKTGRKPKPNEDDEQPSKTAVAEVVVTAEDAVVTAENVFRSLPDLEEERHKTTQRKDSSSTDLQKKLQAKGLRQLNNVRAGIVNAYLCNQEVGADPENAIQFILSMSDQEIAWLGEIVTKSCTLFRNIDGEFSSPPAVIGASLLLQHDLGSDYANQILTELFETEVSIAKVRKLHHEAIIRSVSVRRNENVRRVALTKEERVSLTEKTLELVMELTSK